MIAHGPLRRSGRAKLPLSRGTQIPEYILQGCLAAFKSRNRPSLFVLKSVLPHFRCSLETVAQRQPVEHTGVASINPRTAEPEKRDRPNGL
jgi:hypothetical protein